MLVEDGEFIIGNFSTSNPSRDYMEFGEWNLFHRSYSDLIALAHKIGIDRNFVEVLEEPTGVNLFLRIIK